MVSKIYYCTIHWKGDDDGDTEEDFPVAVGTQEGVDDDLDGRVGFYVSDEAEFESLKTGNDSADFVVLSVTGTEEVYA